METDTEIEARRSGDRIYSEPDADPYESELQSLVGEHDYIALGEVTDRESHSNSSQTEVKVTIIYTENH